MLYTLKNRADGLVEVIYLDDDGNEITLQTPETSVESPQSTEPPAKRGRKRKVS